MNLRQTKNGVSLHFTLLDWDSFKKLISLIWKKFDMRDYPLAYDSLLSLSRIKEIKYAIPQFNEQELLFKYTIHINYADRSLITFDVYCGGSKNQADGLIMMITRGTLQETWAYKATAYNKEGIQICSYVQ